MKKAMRRSVQQRRVHRRAENASARTTPHGNQILGWAPQGRGHGSRDLFELRDAGAWYLARHLAVCQDGCHRIVLLGEIRYRGPGDASTGAALRYPNRKSNLGGLQRLTRLN